MQVFQISLYINVYRYMVVYITATPKAKEKVIGGIAKGHGGVGRGKFQT
jgi:hypothetical protein